MCVNLLLILFIEYKLVQHSERGFAENVPQLTVKGVGLVYTQVRTKLSTFMCTVSFKGILYLLSNMCKYILG